MNTDSRIQNWTEPLTLGEYAAQSAGNGDAPILCTNCSCGHFIAGKCRNCGRPNVVVAERKKRKRPEVYADNCPHCGSANTYVGTTKGAVRQCYCRDCDGEGWKQTA